MKRPDIARSKVRGASLQIVQSWTKQFFSGLRHMHKNGIVHCDVKPDNICVSDPTIIK